MPVLLLILKIIGIALLILFGTLFLVLFAVLFVPLRYRVSAARKEGQGEPPFFLDARAAWLFHLLSLRVSYNGTLEKKIRIFGIPVGRGEKKEKVRRRKSRRKQRKGKKENGREASPEQVGAEETGQAESKESLREEAAPTCRESVRQAKVDEAKQAACGNPLSREETGQPDVRKSCAESAVCGEASPEEQAFQAAGREGRPEEAPELSLEKEDAAGGDDEAALQKKSLWQRIAGFFGRILAFFARLRRFFENIQYTSGHFCDRIDSIRKKLRAAHALLTSEAFQRAFPLCKGELGKVFRAIRPRKLEAALVVGTEDPAVTGELLSACGLLYPLLGGHVSVAGDFERKRLEGQLFLKGRVTGFLLLRAFLKLYFDKNVRQVYTMWKKGGGADGGE